MMASQRFGGRSSVEVVAAWLQATGGTREAVALASAAEAAHVAVIIFAGTGGQLARALSVRGAAVVEIDVLIGGRLHDLLDATPDGIGWHLRRAAQQGVM